MTQEQIEAILEDLFSDAAWQITGSTVSGVTPLGFFVEFREHDLSFDDLRQISEAFGTKNINIGHETRDDGFCDTCSSPYSVTTIAVLFEKTP